METEEMIDQRMETGHRPVATAVATGVRKKYERVGQLMIRPLLVNSGTPAFDLARLFYMQCELNFEGDLIDYMRNGYVVTRPKLFAMVKPIIHKGERIWYVRIVIGNLLEAISCLPCMLPRIAFCRNNQADKMVVVDTKRLIEIAKRIAERSTRNGDRPQAGGYKNGGD